MSTYANGRRLFDADSHLMESVDWLTAYATEAQAGLVKPLITEKGGANIRAAIGAAEARRQDVDRTRELLAQPIISGPKGWGAYGAMDPAERSLALDLLGFEYQLIFPTFAIGQFAASNDPEVVYAGTDMLNRRMADFCRADKRLLPVGYVPLRDPERSVAVVEAAVADGIRAFWVSSEPVQDRSPSHLSHDPVWAALERHQVPVILHIGSGRGLDSRFHNAGHTKVKDWLGGGENLRGKDFPAIAHSVQNFVTAMIYDQVFERFPELMCGIIELGATWVPGFLRTLDQGHMAFRKSEPLLNGLSAKPSEIFRRHVRVSLFPYEDAGWLIEQAGPEVFMFASDWPHPEGGRDPLGRFEQTLEDARTPADARDGFYFRNFASLLNVTV
ncbi:MAG: amidohydrolase [Gammaproteobacteria bacterium]|nr:amidohydrolase [Gammaproteobacteria bacterium]